MKKIYLFFKNYLKYRSIYRSYLTKKIQIEQPFQINDLNNLIIDSYTYIGPGAIFTTYGTITIREGTILGPRVKIHTGNHNYKGEMLPYDEKYIVKNVLIEKNVWIGSDVIILPGVTIGEGCVIGAGSVVAVSIPPLSIAAGNPVRILKKRDSEHYHKLIQENKIYLYHKFDFNNLNKL